MPSKSNNCFLVHLCTFSKVGTYSALYNKPLLLIIKRTLRYINFNYKPPFVCQEQSSQNTQEIWYILLFFISLIPYRYDYELIDVRIQKWPENIHLSRNLNLWQTNVDCKWKQVQATVSMYVLFVWNSA